MCHAHQQWMTIGNWTSNHLIGGICAQHPQESGPPLLFSALHLSLKAATDFIKQSIISHHIGRQFQSVLSEQTQKEVKGQTLLPAWSVQTVDWSTSSLSEWGGVLWLFSVKVLQDITRQRSEVKTSCLSISTGGKGTLGASSPVLRHHLA
jgi:hypothetical protein